GRTFVGQYYFAFTFPAVHVEIFLIRRECQTVRTAQLLTDQLNLAGGGNTIDTADWQLFARIVEEFRQSEGWVSEIERSIRLINQIIRTVEPLSLIPVSKNGFSAILFHSNDPPVDVLVNREPAIQIDSQAIRSWLTVLSNICTVIAAFLAVDGQLAICSVLIHRVGIRIAEEQVFAVLDPYWPFSKLKSFRQLVEFGIARDQFVNCRIQTNDLDVHFAGGDCAWRRWSHFVEIDPCVPHPDVVGRRIGKRTVDAEDCQ